MLVHVGNGLDKKRAKRSNTCPAIHQLSSGSQKKRPRGQNRCRKKKQNFVQLRALSAFLRAKFRLLELRPAMDDPKTRHPTESYPPSHHFLGCAGLRGRAIPALQDGLLDTAPLGPDARRARPRVPLGGLVCRQTEFGGGAARISAGRLRISAPRDTCDSNVRGSNTLPGPGTQVVPGDTLSVHVGRIRLILAELEPRVRDVAEDWPSSSQD